jgi:GDP-mannose transporter
VSSAIAGWTDVADAIQALSYANHVYSNTMIGYFWMAANCVSSASFVLYMRKRMKMSQFKEFDVAYYNNLLSIPVLLIPSLLLEDWSAENLNYNL